MWKKNFFFSFNSQFKLISILYIECSTFHCSVCPDDSCTKCDSQYYLYGNGSCLSDCLLTGGFYTDVD